jgi:hypothetical protein
MHKWQKQTVFSLTVRVTDESATGAEGDVLCAVPPLDKAAKTRVFFREFSLCVCPEPVLANIRFSLMNSFKMAPQKRRFLT